MEISGILANDSLVLHKTGGWHGLGTVVENAPTVREAMNIAKLGWTVEQRPLEYADEEGRLHKVRTHVVNVRSDTGDVLGVVGKDWTPFQNSDLADLCEGLNLDGVVRVETAGSLGNGKKVWLLLKGESFAVAGDRDINCPYILVCNGHDGATAVTAMWTNVRVLCRNTVNRALLSARKSNSAPVRLMHTGGISLRIEEVKQMLGLFLTTTEQQKLAFRALAAVQISESEQREFWLDVYTRVLGLEIPTREVAATDLGAARKRENAQKRAAAWRANAAVEADERGCGRTMWTAYNAVTEEFGQRERDPRLALFGAPALRREKVLEAAMARARR